MRLVRSTTPYASTVLPAIGDSLGNLFVHYQKMLTEREEAVLGLLCVGYDVPTIAKMLLATEDYINQLERRAVAHMIYLYRNGK